MGMVRLGRGFTHCTKMHGQPWTCVCVGTMQAYILAIESAVCPILAGRAPRQRWAQQLDKTHIHIRCSSAIPGERSHVPAARQEQ
jgi:hypothetical protein